MSTLLRECVIAWKEDRNSELWSVMAFDGVLNETHSGATVITSYPVDSGFHVSDHAIRQNRIFELDTVTSKLSMTVATRRQSFEAAYTEIMAAVQQAQATPTPPPESTPPATDGQAMEIVVTGGQMAWDTVTKYGRAHYDNDPGLFSILPEDLEWERSAFDNDYFNPRLFGQASLSKVDEVVEKIDQLCARGTLVHVSTMRAVRPNCVIKGYTVSNNVTNAYSAPIKITLEQLNVIQVNRSTGTVTTPPTNGEGVQQGQSQVRSVDSSTSSFMTRVNVRAPQDIQRKRRSSSEALPEEFYNLAHKEVPFSSQYDTQFIYEGIEYNMGMVRYNESMELWITSLSWRVDGVQHRIDSLPLAAGVNQMQQYGTTIPSFVVVDNTSPDKDPKRTENMRLYIIVDFEKYFLEEVE